MKTDMREELKRCEVKLVVPPPDLARIAAERTKGMVRYFHATVRRVNWFTVDSYLCALAQSAYLQGIQDGIDAAIQGGTREGA